MHTWIDNRNRVCVAERSTHEVVLSIAVYVKNRELMTNCENENCDPVKNDRRAAQLINKFKNCFPVDDGSWLRSVTDVKEESMEISGCFSVQSMGCEVEILGSFPIMYNWCWTLVPFFILYWAGTFANSQWTKCHLLDRID